MQMNTINIRCEPNIPRKKYKVGDTFWFYNRKWTISNVVVQMSAQAEVEYNYTAVAESNAYYETSYGLQVTPTSDEINFTLYSDEFEPENKNISEEISEETRKEFMKLLE